jgi:hypothetical protein
MKAFRLKTTLIGLLALASISTAAVPAAEDALIPPLTLRQTGPEAKIQTRSIHPQVTFLDENWERVIDSDGPLSLMTTCGACHDTEYIARNNYHAQVGLDEMHAAGAGQGSRAWDLSPGMFGRWNPLTYRMLSSRGSEKLDMGTADWIKTMGPRHVGGGPAAVSRKTGEPLTDITPTGEVDPETHVIDPETGNPVPWDWAASGTVEVNCLLCHVREPNNVERTKTLQQGRFREASTATLAGAGLVTRNGNRFNWVRDNFDSDGRVILESFRISEPDSDNCRTCHGQACKCTDPVVYENSLNNWSVETTGEIFSPGRMFDSGMNLKGKEDLSLAFDVHAERLLECTSCHYSMNSPKHDQKIAENKSLTSTLFNSRKGSINDYLIQPDHNLAKGHTAQGTVVRRLDGSMRDCGDCHDTTVGHDFLPYKELHFTKLNCQTCHIPNVYSPARRVTNWTAITPEAEPVVEHRGVEGRVNDPRSLITGYKPVLLRHEENGDEVKLGPHNIIVSWFWVEGEPASPVRLVDLKAAFLGKNGQYHSDIVSALDTDENGVISNQELRLDTDRKVAAVKARLESVAVVNPRIAGEIQPFTLSHGVAPGDFALNDCRACHSYDSRINEKVELASFAPGRVIPTLVGDTRTFVQGEIAIADSGVLIFKPTLDPQELYIHGTDRLKWLDILGILSILGAVFGVAGHGGMRIIAARIRQRGKSA